MKVCKYCANKYGDSVFICQSCGASLSAPVAAVPDTPARAAKKRNYAVPLLIVCGLYLGFHLLYFRPTGETKPPPAGAAVDMEAYRAAYEDYFERGTPDSFERAVGAAPGMAYIPPLVNRFLQKHAGESTPSYVTAAAALRGAGYENDALRVLSAGCKRLGLKDDALLEVVRAWWPMPCDVSPTFTYFDPVARMVGKTWDTLTWEDALQVKFIHIADSFMGVSLEERDDYPDYGHFLSTARYECFTGEDIARAPGFHTTREVLAANVREMLDGAYRQTEEDLSAAIGVFMNVTFLMVDVKALVPSSVMARLPSLRTIYSWQYCDFAAAPDGYASVYDALASLDGLRVLGGAVPMTGRGLAQVEEIDFCPGPRHARDHYRQLVYEDGELAYRQTESPKGRFENLDWQTSLSSDKTCYLSGLYAFEGLRKLTVSGLGQMAQTETLSNLPALRSLTLENCLITEHVSETARLAALEELRIRNTPLLNYSFISGMENLSVLEIEGETKWEVKDGSVTETRLDARYLPDLGGLVSLKELSVGFDGLDGLARLVNLEYLSVGHLPDLTALSGMTGLRHLKTGRCDDLSGAENLTNLETLQIAGRLPQNPEYLPKSLRALITAGLTPSDCAVLLRNAGELRVVMLNNFPSGQGMGEMCAALGEKISLNELSVVPDNPALKNKPLVIAGATVDLAGLTPTPNTVIFDMQPYAGELAKLTGLTALRLQNVSLRSLDFCGFMPNLTYLYVADNLIADLSPLSGLTGLRRLDVSGNLCTWENIVRSVPGGNITVTR